MKKKSNILLLLAIILMLITVSFMAACGSCAHDFKDGICAVCGEADPDYTEGSCTHSYTAGVCTQCGIACTHNYENGICATCRIPCLHSYTDGVCVYCQISCAHSYMNGICIVCKSSCTHSFTDGTCTICGTVCTHNYADGTCTACGTACVHSYAEGVCTTCGMACSHNYTDGTCIVCGITCTHTFEESVCTQCGMNCTHTYDKEICTVCGFENPDYRPEDKGRSLYNEIVEKYKYLVLYKYMNEELPPRIENDPFYMDALYEVVGQFDPTMNFGYSFKDIDGDGYVELLLVENSNRLYAIFTVKEQVPAIVATFQQGMGYLGHNGMIFFNVKRFGASGGQILLGNYFTHLIDGKLVGIAYGWEDADGNYDTQDDEKYYYISADGVKNDITYDDYKAIRDEYAYYWEAPTRLTKQNNLQFNPALIAGDMSDITADFSTYDEIIKTFGLMHSKVTEGKCVRSKWISGAYDAGMRFKCEEDFVIYNRLFAACVLVQSKEKATFGYAKKDLNSDGVEELILLESNFHVLAIFTEMDGKMVLLDSYNDLRTAFIDENGRIHVRQRVLPGMENDCEYFVYEVGAGELLVKVAIGIKFDAKGEQKKIYQISDGTAADLDQTAWNELYAEFSLDIGEIMYHTYTKDKSGLIFTAAPII
ncbi:MAG: hypothetical protein E7645_04065 [Ruminococcaceae bacterium]|nr:hypothetical protein [Oscillospiraceae bacterium]